MPEEQAPATEQETPETTDEATPQGTPAESTEETIDYQKRYDDLRPEFDRTNQRVKEFEEFFGHLANPETQAEALRQLGLELQQDEEDDDEEYADPTDQLSERLAELEQTLAQRDEEAQELEYLQGVNQNLTQQLDALPKDLTAEERDAIANYAINSWDADAQEYPDVKAAHEWLDGVVRKGRERYVASKKSEAVQTGTAGIESLDINDEDARRKAIAEIIAATPEEDA